MAGPSHLSRRTALRLGGLALPALALPGALTACGTATGSQGRVLRVAQTADPKTLDPQRQGDLFSMNVLINLFDTLTTRDPDNRLAPGLALSWSAPDPLTWRFRLRPGVCFHNGEPCDAHAVAFSLNRLLDPATKSPIVELRYVRRAVAVDALTVDLQCSQPDPIIPAKVSLFGGVAVPPGYLKQVGSAGFAKHPVGTGPFTFEQFQRDHQLRMRANPRYWGGRPDYDELVFLPMPEPSSALASLQSDEVDIVAGLTPDAALQIQGYRGVEIRHYPGIRTSYLSLDTTQGPLRDVRVRQALNHAVDVPLLIKAVLDGKAREVPTMFPRESFGFDPSVAPYTRDLGLAKKLLADAGFPDGFDTTLTAQTTDANVAEAISGLLARAGVRARVELVDTGTYSSRLTSSNRGALGPIYLAASTGWTLDAESLVQSNVRHDRRQSRWHNAEADRLVDAEEQSLDPADRQRAFSGLQRLLKQEAPFVFLYQIDNIYAVDTKPRWQPGVVGVLAMAGARVSA
ncbi:ABC transporter substrate-binding protein [Amycolatopsis jiangsuensis]|uniref:Peptide/nickel transport system substrate-binding protein n=1 Tax=Amycolatopsis jiangsuensis TaxID=1181879 RepID=A0A840IS17_9PSEU|nr:ABC transporter substrate-binding protein [Amycolatopsis jiangsuensis]MBB4684235.1 peptide/nickel transport system substrate-binding protein [Amycolatopsis jiangsuensis]